MAYLALDVAKYVVNYCYSIKKQPISNLKLQKMLFFIWIDYYKQTNKYLFEENFYAWQFGPVIPEVYYEFSCYGGLPITRDFSEAFDERLTELEEYINEYINCTARELVDRTHAQESSWYITYNKNNSTRKEIPFNLIIKTECRI